MMLSVVVLFLGAGPGAAPLRLPADITPSAAAVSMTTFQFRDRGALRSATRGPRPGTDAAPVDVVYADPATGRSTQALIGSGVIIKLPGSDSVVFDLAAQSLDIVPVRALFASLGLWLVTSTRRGEDGLALAQRLTPAVADGVLLEAFPDLHLRHTLAQEPTVSLPPDDPRYPAQFFFDDLDMEQAWTLSVGDPSVVVAVVDNGCDELHPDLQAKLDPGHDVIDDDDDPAFFPDSPGNEHGTACAGLIAAVTDNGVDVAGACPRCRATCTRMLSATGAGVPLNADVRAFGAAFDDDVDVVSNSWGFVDAIPVPGVLAEAITEVHRNGRGGLGAVVVFATGNDFRLVGDDELLAVEGVIGVGAVNNLGELTQFSNFGAAVDIVAPTGTVTTDISGSDGANAGDVTFAFGGTSSACPIVAGIAGLLLGLAPELTSTAVAALLTDSAKQSVFASPNEAGHDDEYGFGLVQPAVALQLLVGADVPDAPELAGGSGCECGQGGSAGATLGLGCWLLIHGRPRQRRRR